MGLVLAYIGGVVTGGEDGMADLSLFSGVGLMGGGIEDWKKVNAEEIRRGEEMGKERERMDWEEAHSFLAKVRS